MIWLHVITRFSIESLLGGAINMDETDSQIEWNDGSGESVEIGYRGQQYLLWN